MIIMDSKTQLTVDVITKVSEGKITINNAAKLLACSRRTIERYLNRYQKLGIMFAIHGNTGKNPVNKIPADLKLKVQALIKEKYYDVNLQHLAELLALNEGISIKRETLRTWAHDIHHVKRAKRRRSQVRKKRERMESSGLLLQMDGSTHKWFGDKKSCLIAIIDDATSEIHAEFFKSETTQGCLKVMRDYIEKKEFLKPFMLTEPVFLVDQNDVTSHKCKEHAKSWVLKLSSPIPHKAKAVSNAHSIHSKTASSLNYAYKISTICKTPIVIYKRFSFLVSGKRLWL